VGEASSSRPPPLSGFSHQDDTASWFRIEAKTTEDVVAGRIGYSCEMDWAKVEAVVEPLSQTLPVTYSDGVMPMNRVGAFEDSNMARNFEGGCWAAWETA